MYLLKVFDIATKLLSRKALLPPQRRTVIVKTAFVILIGNLWDLIFAFLLLKSWGACLTQSKEHATLDLRVLSVRLRVEITK